VEQAHTNEEVFLVEEIEVVVEAHLELLVLVDTPEELHVRLALEVLVVRHRDQVLEEDTQHEAHITLALQVLQQMELVPHIEEENDHHILLAKEDTVVDRQQVPVLQAVEDTRDLVRTRVLTHVHHLDLRLAEDVILVDALAEDSLAEDAEAVVDEVVTEEWVRKLIQTVTSTKQ
jgi:hypothetical protein